MLRPHPLAFLRHLLGAALLALSPAAWPEGVSQHLIFADVAHVGGFACQQAGAGSFCEAAIAVFGADGRSLNRREHVQDACLQALGECDNFVLATAVRQLAPGLLAAQVLSRSGKPVWVRVKASAWVPLEKLIPTLGEGANQVFFRPELKFVYEDASLSKKLAVSDVTELSRVKPRQAGKPALEFDLGYKDITTDALRRKNTVALELYLLKTDPGLAGEGDEASSPGAERSKIRVFYFPARDALGRINYWFGPSPE
jgi:hypothetical protein